MNGGGHGQDRLTTWQDGRDLPRCRIYHETALDTDGRSRVGVQYGECSHRCPKCPSRVGQSHGESTARNPTTYRSNSVSGGGLGDLGQVSHFFVY